MTIDSTTALEFLNQFATEDACLAAIEELRWPNGFRCPNCEHDVAYFITTRRLKECAVCRFQTSVTAGTIFHKTRIPLTTWFYIIYCIASDKGGTSCLRLSQQLNMHYSTVWHIVHKIRFAMSRRDEGILLAGLIEFDGMFVGPEARKMGKPSTQEEEEVCLGKSRRPREFRFSDGSLQTSVLVMVEAEHAAAGNVAMRVVTSLLYDDIQEFAELRAEPGQHFKSDAFGSNFALRTVASSHKAKTCSGKKSLEWLPVVHRVIALVKRFLLGTYHGVSPRYLQSYLDEFCFRFNRRSKFRSLASSLLRACVFALPVSYPELIR